MTRRREVLLLVYTHGREVIAIFTVGRRSCSFGLRAKCSGSIDGGARAEEPLNSISGSRWQFPDFSNE
jgi:hypothetical protein